MLLRADARFATIEVKTHAAHSLPFGRLRFKIKREIIRMNELGIRPQAGRAPAVDATTLQRWLDAGHCDAGRPVVMLDTRNAFEVDAGRFDGALDWRLSRFSDFPAALQAHRGRVAGQDRGELLHRRHPLRKGRAVDGPGGCAPCAAAGRRHPALL
jgi:UPF0176 protein